MQKRVAIIGGGISGIAAATFLKKMSPDIEIDLYEKSPRLGGWIETLPGEFPFELGPRTLSYERSPYILKLLEELDMQEEIVMARASSKRYLCNGKRLLSLPPDLASLWSHPLFYASFFKALILEPFQKVSSQDETIDSFFCRRFGKKVGGVLASSLAKGVFGGDSRELSINACFPKLKQMEKDGSLLVSMLKKKKTINKTELCKKGLFSLEDGLENLITTFAKNTACKIYLGTEVISLATGSEKDWAISGIDLQGNTVIKEYDAVILALPHKGLIKVLSKSPTLLISQEILRPISDLQSNSLTLVCVGMKEKGTLPKGTLPKGMLPKGFGFLMQGHVETPLLGCVFDSELFPEVAPGKIRVTFMLQGEVEKEKAKEIALESMQKILSIAEKPEFLKVHLCKSCIPQYPVGYKEKWDAFLSELKGYPGLICSSTAGDGVSLEDCTRKGYFAALEVENLSQGAATRGCVTERSGSPKT